jgi:hypothetical protein
VVGKHQPASLQWSVLSVRILRHWRMAAVQAGAQPGKGYLWGRAAR